MNARPNRTRRGQTLVIVAACAAVLCVVAALAVDMGHVCAAGARLQNAADAAAKAAVLHLYARRQGGEDENTARQAAFQEARAICQANYPAAGIGVVFGRWESRQFTPADASIPANAARARAYRNEGAPGGPVRMFFAPVLGLDEMNQARSATARSGRPAFVPFGLYEGDLPPVGQTMVIYNDQKVAPGVFGLLDFDGGEHSAEEAKAWTRYGYPGPIELAPEPDHLILEGTTGLKTSIKAGVGFHIAEGDTLIACIYREVSGKAEDAHFEIVGLAAIVLTAQSFADELGEEYESIEARLVDTYFVDSGENAEQFLRRLGRVELVE